jgi:predicted DNA-binding antitoxin AbrB/MazE fold protein
MTEPITAIYENGVFRPLQSVDLNDHTIVSLAIVGQCGEREAEADVFARQQPALDRLLAETATMAQESPDDALSNRDHDLILYGWKK